MTAQVSDSVVYKDQEYSLVAFSDGEPFDPSVHGYRPEMASTACYRGYLAGYEVTDGALFLGSLRISHQDSDLPESQNKRPPPLNGVEAELSETSYAGKWSFQNIGLPLAYSGGLVVAKGFISSLYVHMGFHPAWKYEEVHELIFERGKLISACELSSKVAEIRERLSSEEESSDEFSWARFDEWVKECFRRDYHRNANQ